MHTKERESTRSLIRMILNKGRKEKETFELALV
jgi:hypothetical protein